VNKSRLVDEYKQADSRLILLDYDGVLAPIMPLPEQAAPSRQAYDLLAKLAANKKNTCVVVSGRHRETLEEWLGALPLAFAAEHGTWRRAAMGEWERASVAATTSDWKQEVRSIMRSYVDKLDGVFIEEKTEGIGLHYRTAVDQKYAEAKMSELVQVLGPVVRRLSLRTLHGKKIVEVIPGSTSKGAAARFWLDQKDWPFILAIGDDVTDEALFGELPEYAWSIKVGGGETLARERVETQTECMQLLESLVVL